MGWDFRGSWEEVNIYYIWERCESLEAKGQTMVASIKAGPKDPLLIFMPFCSILPQWIGLVSVTNRLCGTDDVWLLSLGHKRHRIFYLALSWIITSFGRIQLPCHEDTQAVLWNGPNGKELRSCGKELRTPVNNHMSDYIGSRFSSPSQVFRWPQSQLTSWDVTKDPDTE